MIRGASFRLGLYPYPIDERGSTGLLRACFLTDRMTDPEDGERSLIHHLDGRGRVCPSRHRRHNSLFSEAFRFALRYLFAIGSTSVNAAEACQLRCVHRLNPPALPSVVQVVGGRFKETGAI